MRKIHMFIMLVIVSTLLGSCAASPGAPTRSGSLKVLATETFLADIAQNVAGDRIKIEILIPFEVDPHEFEPRPDDITTITDSQVLIVNGLGYEAWLQKTLENMTSQQLLVVASSALTPIPDPSGEHAEGDPHLWMDPLNVVKYVETIRDGLSQADPAGKDIYARNAE